MKTLYIILLYLCATITGFAQNQGKCELLGHVFDEKTEEHLPFVNIYIKGTTTGTTTDATGHFMLTKLPEGTVTVIAKYVGYKTIEKEVALTPGKTVEVMIAMTEESLELNPVVVSANRNEVSRKEALAIVNVLSPLTFEATNSSVLSGGLNFMTGVRVENNCQNCGYQQVRINGLDGQYSQILIDSRPIVSALAGVYGIEQVPTGMIERVEVLRGGGSSLYGSNAIAGVVNIITKEPLNNSGSLANNLTLIGGDAVDNSTNLNVSLISNDRKGGMYVFGNIWHRQPFDVDGDGFTELPELKSSTAGFRGFYRTSDYSKLTLEYHNISEKRRGGDSLNRPPHEANIAEMLEHDINGGGAKFDLYTPDYKQKISLYASAQYTDRNSYYGTGQNPNAYGNTTDLTADGGVQYSYDFEKLWFMPANLIVGVEYNYEKLHDYMPGYNRDIRQTTNMSSLFVQNEWKNEMFSFLLGARLDKHNMLDNPVFSPRLNIRYNPVENIGLRASYSEGFRAPQTFSEDLHITMAGGEAVLVELNPDLKPERSRSFNLSADLYHTFGEVRANLLIEGFYTALRDVFVEEEIGTNANGDIIKQKRNGSGAVVQGANIETKVVFGSNYQLQAGVTFQSSKYDEPEQWGDTEDATTSNMLRTPDFYGYFTATAIPLKRLTLALSGTYTGHMYVPHLAGYIDTERLEKTPAFFDANCKLSYTFRLKGDMQLQLSAGVQNIFNAYQNDFDQGPNRDSGYIYGPVMPRSYFAGLKLSM